MYVMDGTFLVHCFAFPRRLVKTSLATISSIMLSSRQSDSCTLRQMSFNIRPIADRRTSAQSIGHHLFYQASNELVLVGEDHPLQTRRAVDGLSAGERAAGIDWKFARCGCVPCRATARLASKFSKANPIGSMRAWHDAQVGLLRCSSSRCRMDMSAFAPLAGKAGHFRRRRGRWGAQDLLKHKLAALGRRRSRWHCRHRHNAGHRDYTAAALGGVALQSDLSKISAIHAFNPIEFREPPIDESVVGVNQLQQAAFLPKHMPEETARPRDASSQQLAVKIGETARGPEKRYPGCEAQAIDLRSSK